MKPPITELDFTVLGVVAQAGPISAYDVRKIFSSSLTPRWSSSTGSIYPSVKRLSEAGLVHLAARKGTRGKQLIQATKSGLAQLSNWIRTVTEEDGAPLPDPIRTKAHFLDILSLDERDTFLVSAIAATDRVIRKVENAIASSEEKQDRLLRLGSLLQLRARREWLVLIRERDVAS